MTNIERIKAMSVEEMAEDMPCPHTGYTCEGEFGYNGAQNCYECSLAWLESEVQDE